MNTVFHEENVIRPKTARRQTAVGSSTFLAQKLLKLKWVRNARTADRLVIIGSTMVIGICIATIIITTRPPTVDEQYYFDPERAKLERLNQ